MPERDNNPRPRFDGRPKGDSTRPEPRTGALEAAAQDLGGTTLSQPAPVSASRVSLDGPRVAPAKALQNAPSLSTDTGRGLQQAGDRALSVDAMLSRYFTYSYTGRSGGHTLSPYVAFTREFEGALLNEAAERQGLLANRDGRGAEQSRSFLQLNKAISSTFKGGDEAHVLWGAPLAAFNEKFSRALEEKKRELNSSLSDEARQFMVAAQLRVQQNPIRFVDPDTSAVVPAYAARVPSGDGEWQTYGFQVEGKIRSREVQVVADGEISERWSFDPTEVISPEEAGLDELLGSQGVLGVDGVLALRNRGVELVSHPVRPQDLLAGTVLDSQDGSRVVLAGLLSESLQEVVDHPAIEAALRAGTLQGTEEILNRADKATAATLVTMARLDRATRDDVNRATEGSLVDPMAQVIESLRATIMPLAVDSKTDQMKELDAKVRENIRAMGESLPARPTRGDHRGKLKKALVDEMNRLDRFGNGDVFAAIAKVTSLAVERADERNTREGTSSRENYGSDLAVITHRANALTAALGDVKAVLGDIGLDQKALAAFGTAPLFDQKLEVLLGTSTESALGRAFAKTHRLMQIYVHGEVGKGRPVDPFAQEHPTYDLANEVMGGIYGLVRRDNDLSLGEGIYADAYLVEAARAHIDALGGQLSPESLSRLQQVAGTALADHEAGHPIRDFKSNADMAGWYRLVRDTISVRDTRIREASGGRLRGGIPASEEELQAVIEQLTDPKAKTLMQRGAALIGLVGAHYGAMKAENRVPGFPVRLGKVNASLRLAQVVPSGIADVPHYMSNPSGYVRLVQLQDDAGKPSGKYLKMVGEVKPTGVMSWSPEGLLSKPRTEIPSETHKAGIAKRRVEIMHASLKAPLPVSELGGKRVLDEQEVAELAAAVSDHFSDVPLTHGGFLGHGMVDGGDGLPQLGIYLPSGAVRPMNLANANVVLSGGAKGLHFDLDLVPLSQETGDFARKRNGEIESPKRISFADLKSLQEELERRVEAAIRNNASDVDYLTGVARGVLDAAALIFNAKPVDHRVPVLAFMPTAGGEQRPCGLLVVPLAGAKRTRERKAHKDPAACTKAYAQFTFTMAKVGASFEGHETKA